MKKIILLSIFFLLTACSLPWQATSNPAKNLSPVIEKAIHDDYVQDLINKLDKKVKNGEITADEAKNIFEKTIQQNKKLNDGSTESILKKIELTDPKTAQILRERIKKNHPEALSK